MQRIEVEKDGTVNIVDTGEVAKIGDIVAANPPGHTSDTVVPDLLNERVLDVFKAQVSSKGNRLPGFDDDSAKLINFGVQPKKARAKKDPNRPAIIAGTEGEQDDSTNVVPPNADMLDRWVRQVLWTESLPLIHRLLTGASDSFLGAPGKAAKDPNPVLPASDREAASEVLAAIRDLAHRTGGTMLGRSGEMYGKTNVAAVRWTAPNEVEVEAEADPVGVQVEADAPQSSRGASFEADVEAEVENGEAAAELLRLAEEAAAKAATPRRRSRKAA